MICDADEEIMIVHFEFFAKRVFDLFVFYNSDFLEQKNKELMSTELIDQKQEILNNNLVENEQKANVLISSKS